MQVASIHGDRANMRVWAKQLSQHILLTDWKAAQRVRHSQRAQRVVSTRNAQHAQDAQHADVLLCQLLLLPAPLLHLVLSNCLAVKTLPTLLRCTPLPLHPGLFAAAAGNGNGTLAVPRRGLERTLELLANAAVGLQAPHAGGLSLRTFAIIGDNDDAGKNQDSPDREAADDGIQESRGSALSAASAPLLGRVLSTQTALTSLHLDCSFLDAQWLRNFRAALSAGSAGETLPHLVDLRLGLALLPRTLPELAACLRTVRTVKHLALGFLLPGSTAPEATAVSLQDVGGATATPVLLPGLQEFTVSEVAHDPDGAPGPTTQSSCIHMILPMFTAPAMTRLGFTTTAACMPYSSFLSALTRSPALRAISIDAEVRDVNFSVGGCEGAADRRLRELRNIQICSANTICSTLLGAALCAHAGTALGSLCLQRTPGECPIDSLSDLAVQEAAGWCGMLRALRTMPARTGLQQLELRSLGWAVRDSEAVTTALSRALRHLPALTHLVLEAGADPRHVARSNRPTVLCGETVGHALRTLEHLKMLVLRDGEDGGGRLRIDNGTEVLHACAEMPMLRTLSVCCHGLPRSDVVSVLPKLTALTGLELRPQEEQSPLSPRNSGTTETDEGTLRNSGLSVAEIRSAFPELEVWEGDADE